MGRKRDEQYDIGSVFADADVLAMHLVDLREVLEKMRPLLIGVESPNALSLREGQKTLVRLMRETAVVSMLLYSRITHEETNEDIERIQREIKKG